MMHRPRIRDPAGGRRRRASATTICGLLIDGEWLKGEGRRTLPVINPATEEVLGQLPLASPADLDRALEAAQRAWPAWRAMAPVQRGRILRRAAEILRSRVEEIARLATTEEGKTLAETRIEVGMSANIFEWYAEEGRRAYGRVLPQQSPGVRMTVVREPVGPGRGLRALELPARQSGAKARRGPGRRMHLHTEARRGGARVRARDRGCAGRGRRAGRRYRHRVRGARPRSPRTSSPRR